MDETSNTNDTRNIPHGEEESGAGGVVRPNLAWPAFIWKQVRMIALEREVTATQLVVDVVVEHLGLKRAA